MQIGGKHVSPFLYRNGGRIVGDYMFLGDKKIRMTNTADIELALEEARIQQEGDKDNFICFREGETFVSKDLEVAGKTKIHDAEIENDLHIKGDLTVDKGIIVQNGLFSYGAVQGAAGLFTGAVTGAGAVFASVQSALSTMGQLSALSISAPSASLLTLTSNMITVTHDVNAQNLFAERNIIAQGDVTGTRVYGTTEVNAPRGTFIYLNVNNAFAAPANIQGSLSVLGTITGATVNATLDMNTPLLEAVNVTTTNLVSTVSEIGQAVAGNFTAASVEAANCDIANGTFLLVDTQNLVANLSIESPNATLATLESANATLATLESGNATLGVTEIATGTAANFGVTTRLTAAEAVIVTLQVEGMTTGVDAHFTGQLRANTGRIDNQLNAHLISTEDLDATSIETDTCYVGKIYSRDFETNQVEIEMASNQIRFLNQDEPVLRIHANGVRVPDEKQLQVDELICNTAALNSIGVTTDFNIECDAMFEKDVDIIGELEVPTVRTDMIRPHHSEVLMVDGFNVVQVGNKLDVHGVVTAPNIDSSGSFTHCHVCEPEDQSVDWSSLTGRLIESTGVCAVRDDAGVLITDFKQAPGLAYAMPSVRVASTSCLGVLLSVAEVENSQIKHAHGIMLSHQVSEPDGYKMLRVCGAGDCFVWTVKPLASEVPLTVEMLGGLYTKYENGIEQSEKVVVSCNSDYSFMMTTAASSSEALASRVSQLEMVIQELTRLT